MTGLVDNGGWSNDDNGLKEGGQTLQQGIERAAECWSIDSLYNCRTSKSAKAGKKHKDGRWFNGNWRYIRGICVCHKAGKSIDFILEYGQRWADCFGGDDEDGSKVLYTLGNWPSPSFPDPLCDRYKRQQFQFICWRMT